MGITDNQGYVKQMMAQSAASAESKFLSLITPYKNKICTRLPIDILFPNKSGVGDRREKNCKCCMCYVSSGLCIRMFHEIPDGRRA